MSVAEKEFYTVYFGGELFSGKHLLGNAALAEAIRDRSHGRFRPLLPQDFEQRALSAHAVRDQDIRALLGCDLGVFNYDGPELDSGTVVEFMFAKFADIPAVLLRTDFRNAGDQMSGSDPWNLMSSFYPRTSVLVLNAMSIYQDGLGLNAAEGQSASVAAGRHLIATVADAVIASCETLVRMPAHLPPELRAPVERWLELMPGFGDDAAKFRL
jgi:nucleoside 2-deoxyribosyltransferase